VATFGELWAAILPAAVPLAPPDPAQRDREVGWVRVLKARVPAFDALDPGDVAIVPASSLASVAPSAVETAALVDALASARCAGILVVEGDEPDAAVEELGAAARAAGLPALRVPRVDPGQLERSVIGFLLNRRAELEHQAGLLEAALEEVALGSGDVSALIAAVGAFLGRAVALEGRRGEVLAVHAPDQAPGAVAAVRAYITGSRTAALRIPLPAAPGAAVAPGAPPPVRPPSAGRLVLLGEQPVSDLERVVGPRVGRLLALEMARADALERAQGGRRRAETLPADGPPWVVLVARQVASGTEHGSTVEAREEIRSRLRVIASPRRLALRGDADSLELRLVLAVRSAGSAPGPASQADPGSSGGEPATAGLSADVLELADKVAGLLERPVAVSRPFGSAVGRPPAEAEARATLDAIEALPERPRVARADRLPVYRLLASVQALSEGSRWARALLEPVLAGSADARRERLATLRAVLEQPGSAEAAAALGVHRNTLAYRIRRIEQVTGWRLADPDIRLAVAIAVRIVQTEQ
jgi:purine catabolism regulator